jgi:hypothetical protein
LNRIADRRFAEHFESLKPKKGEWIWLFPIKK